MNSHSGTGMRVFITPVMRARLAEHVAVLAGLLASEWRVPGAYMRSWHATYIWPNGTLIRATWAQQRHSVDGLGFIVGIVARNDQTVALNEMRAGLSVDIEAAAIFLGLDDIDTDKVQWAITL